MCSNDKCTGSTNDSTVVKDHQSWCAAIAINSSTNPKIVDEYDKTDEQIPAVLQAAKLVDFKVPPYGKKKLTSNDRQHFILHNNGGFSVNAFYVNYKSTARMVMRGFSPKFHSIYIENDKTADSEKLYKLVLNHNVQLYVDDTTTTSKRVKVGSALNSSMASILDAKIDDGRPFSGRLLGLRNKTTYAMTDPEQLVKYCYDKTGENVEKAIYNSDTNEEYGCNLVYIMDDVK